MHVRKTIIGVAAALAVIPAGSALAATIEGGPNREHLRGTRAANPIKIIYVYAALTVFSWSVRTS